MDKAYQEIPATFESIDTILTQILKTIVGSSSDEFMFKYAVSYLAFFRAFYLGVLGG